MGSIYKHIEACTVQLGFFHPAVEIQIENNEPLSSRRFLHRSRSTTEKEKLESPMPARMFSEMNPVEGNVLTVFHQSVKTV